MAKLSDYPDKGKKIKRIAKETGRQMKYRSKLKALEKYK